MSAPTATSTDSGWEVRVRCRFCRCELPLRSEEAPTELGLKFAAVNVWICDPCDEAQERESERTETEAARRERLRVSGLPETLRGLKWSDMSHSGRAVEAARRWAQIEDPGGVCLHGSTGVGKTRLAATTAWHRLQRWPIRWVSVSVLMAQLDAAWNDQDRRDALKVLTGSGALVLDDLDKVVPSERGRNHLFTAIDARVQAGAPLLVTMNSSLSGLAEKFGDPIASRLGGYCRGAIFDLQGPDRRLVLGAEGAVA